MKAILFLACLFVAPACFSQTVYPVKFERPRGRFFEVKEDTLELTGNIRFIKVDGKVYEIKRSTSIEEVKPYGGLFFGHGQITSDSLFLKGMPNNLQIWDGMKVPAIQNTGTWN